MRTLFLVIINVFLAASLSGCLLTRNQVKEQENRRETQNQAIAMQTAQSQDMEQRMRELNGRIETLENQLEKSAAEKRTLESRHDGDRKELEGKLKIYEEALNKMEQQYLVMAQKLEALQASSAATSTKDSAKKSNKNSFDQAEDDFKKKNYQNAVAGYQTYRDNNPKGKNYAEATYKMGVSFQELGMKADALPFFNEVVEKFPKSKSAEKAKIRLKQLK